MIIEFDILADQISLVEKQEVFVCLTASWNYLQYGTIFKKIAGFESTVNM